MKWVHGFFKLAYSLILAMFVCCAVALVVFGALELWRATDPGSGLALRGRFSSILDSIGLLTIAVAALELAQTILEEEVQRQAHMGAPTRVRRFLSRFMVVIIVSLCIECLVAVFQLVHDDPEKLIHASSIGMVAALLLAAWGLFVKLNTSAEALEPEAMKQAKEEDQKVESESPVVGENVGDGT